MAELLQKLPTSYEPLKTNRWLIRIADIPEYMVKDFTLESEKVKDKFNRVKDAIKLTTHIRNAVHYLLVPDVIMGTNKLKIEFLDPTGVMVNYYDMTVDFEKISLVGDYGSSDILTHKVEFWVKEIKSMDEDEALKAYKEKLEEGRSVHPAITE